MGSVFCVGICCGGDFGGENFGAAEIWAQRGFGRGEDLGSDISDAAKIWAWRRFGHGGDLGTAFQARRRFGHPWRRFRKGQRVGRGSTALGTVGAIFGLSARLGSKFPALRAVLAAGRPSRAKFPRFLERERHFERGGDLGTAAFWAVTFRARGHGFWNCRRSYRRNFRAIGADFRANSPR